MATIVVFVLSLFMASVMIVIKAIELRNEKKNILLRLINKLDSRLINLVSTLKFKSLQLIQSIRYIILVETKRVAKELFNKVQEKVANEYKKRQQVIIVGKKQITNKGSVSFYLKKITEDKGNTGKGKIDSAL